MFTHLTHSHPHTSHILTSHTHTHRVLLMSLTILSTALDQISEMDSDSRKQGGKEGRERRVEKVGCYLNLFLHLQSPCGDADRKLAALWPVAGACFHQDAGMKTHHQPYPGTSCSTEVVDRLVDIFVHLFLHTHTHSGYTMSMWC